MNGLAVAAIAPYHFDGCTYDFVSTQRRTFGRSIRMPWTIAATATTFAQLHRQCPRSPSEHAKREGADTRRTEGYTDPLAIAIHEA